MKVTAQKISKGSVFKIYFIGLGGGFFILFLIFGISAMFGAEAVKWEEEPVTGIRGFVVAMLMWPFFTIMFSGFMWLISILGLWLYSLLRPINVTFKNIVSDDVPNV
jgi:hypothetical protein